MKSSVALPARTALAAAIACLLSAHGPVSAQGASPPAGAASAPDAPAAPAATTAPAGPAPAAAGGAANVEGPGAASPDPQAEGAGRVIVTAQKRPQFADKVPMSLSALGREQLERTGAVDILDLSRLSPGLSAAATTIFGTPNIAIRGIASTAGAATTAVYIDDAPIQVRGQSAVAGGTAYPQLFDLDRVEVLRGPQGTLFGSSAEGGAIRFITPAPRFDKASGELRAGLSATRFGDPSWQAGVAAGGPLGGTIAYRASLWHKRDGGWMDHVNRQTGALTDSDSNVSEATVGRVALSIRPTEALSITPAVFVQRTHEHDRTIWYEDAGLFKTYNHLRQPTRDRFTLSSLSVGYELDSVSIKSVTSRFDRRQRRIDDYSYAITPGILGGEEVLPGHPDYIALNRQSTDQRNLTQELRISSNDGADSRLSWVAGLYFSRARQTQAQRIEQDIETFALAAFGAPAVVVFGQPGTGPGGIYSYTQDDVLSDRDEAIFGEASYKLQPRTTFTMGLRASRNRFTFSTLETGPFSGGPIDFGGEQKGRALLPKLSLSHELNASDMVYATAAKGHRVGGANPSYAGIPGCQADLRALGIADAPRTYDADSLWSYEVGYKARFLDRRLDLATSAFYIDWTDIQSSVTLPICLFGYTANLGSARSVGADLQLQYRMTPQLQLAATLAYTDAQYTRTTFANGSSSGTGRPLVLKGQALPAPGVNVTLGAEYSWVPGTGQRAFVRADYQYAGGYKRTAPQGGYNHDPGLYEAPETHHVSLQAGWRQGSWEFNGYVNNLLDERTQLMRTRNSPTDPNFQTATFRPRTVGVTATYRY